MLPFRFAKQGAEAGKNRALRLHSFIPSLVLPLVAPCPWPGSLTSEPGPPDGVTQGTACVSPGVIVRVK